MFPFNKFPFRRFRDRLSWLSCFIAHYVIQCQPKSTERRVQDEKPEKQTNHVMFSADLLFAKENCSELYSRRAFYKNIHCVIKKTHGFSRYFITGKHVLSVVLHPTRFHRCIWVQNLKLMITPPSLSFLHLSREDFQRIPELAINPLGDRIINAFFPEG